MTTKSFFPLHFNFCLELYLLASLGRFRWYCANPMPAGVVSDETMTWTRKPRCGLPDRILPEDSSTWRKHHIDIKNTCSCSIGSNNTHYYKVTYNSMISLFFQCPHLSIISGAIRVMLYVKLLWLQNNFISCLCNSSAICRNAQALGRKCWSFIFFSATETQSRE